VEDGRLFELEKSVQEILPFAVEPHGNLPVAKCGARWLPASRPPALDWKATLEGPCVAVGHGGRGSQHGASRPYCRNGSGLV
jgi:hypothetical protein